MYWIAFVRCFTSGWKIREKKTSTECDLWEAHFICFSSTSLHHIKRFYFCFTNNFKLHRNLVLSFISMENFCERITISPPKDNCYVSLRLVTKIDTIQQFAHWRHKNSFSGSIEFKSNVKFNSKLVLYLATSCQQIDIYLNATNQEINWINIHTKIIHWNGE